MKDFSYATENQNFGSVGSGAEGAVAWNPTSVSGRTVVGVIVQPNVQGLVATFNYTTSGYIAFRNVSSASISVNVKIITIYAKT